MHHLLQGEGLPTTARERILHTAHRLFYAHGIQATGIDRVIAEARITKTTFYRHFPSKNDLILAYLALRHARWLSWFQASLAQHGGTAGALVPTLKAWFEHADFRGCAFINAVNELSEALPEVVSVSRAHKQDMVQVIAALLPASRRRSTLAQALALAVDGATVQAQMGGETREVLRALQGVVKALLVPVTPD